MKKNRFQRNKLSLKKPVKSIFNRGFRRMLDHVPEGHDLHGLSEKEVLEVIINDYEITEHDPAILKASEDLYAKLVPMIEQELSEGAIHGYLVCDRSNNLLSLSKSLTLYEVVIFMSFQAELVNGTLSYSTHFLSFNGMVV